MNIPLSSGNFILPFTFLDFLSITLVEYYRIARTTISLTCSVIGCCGHLNLKWQLSEARLPVQ